MTESSNEKFSILKDTFDVFVDPALKLIKQLSYFNSPGNWQHISNEINSLLTHKRWEYNYINIEPRIFVYNSDDIIKFYTLDITLYFTKENGEMYKNIVQYTIDADGTLKDEIPYVVLFDKIDGTGNMIVGKLVPGVWDGMYTWEFKND